MTGDKNGQSGQINWERVARAETHPLRLSILELLAIDGGRVLSPKEMADELQARLSNINYHAACLCESELVQLVYEHDVGGTIEHFYCLPGYSAADRASWMKQWHESMT